MGLSVPDDTAYMNYEEAGSKVPSVEWMLGVSESPTQLWASESAPVAGVSRPVAALRENATGAMLLEFTEMIQWHGDIFRTPDQATQNYGLNFFRRTGSSEWALLISFVAFALVADVCIIQRYMTDSRASYLAVLFFWICCGLIFNGSVFLRQGMEKGTMWLSGYLLEFLLGLDNLFIFHLIFNTYSVPKEQIHKALFLGILGAVVFRMIFFLFLSTLLHLVHVCRLACGVLLIFSGIQAAKGDKESDVSELYIVCFLRRLLGDRLLERYDTEQCRLFLVEDGKVKVTLLFAVITCLEVIDILFAVDSVSAKVAQISDHYVAYSSSVLAVFGLRSLFFVLRDLVDCFELLQYGLCFILIFIGVELFVEDYVKLSAQVVCLVILAVFFVCILASAANYYEHNRKPAGKLTHEENVEDALESK